MPRKYQKPIGQNIINWSPTPSWGYLPALQKDARRINFPVYYTAPCIRGHEEPRMTETGYCLGCFKIEGDEYQRIKALAFSLRQTFSDTHAALNAAAVPIRYSDEVAATLLRCTDSVDEVLA